MSATRSIPRTARRISPGRVFLFIPVIVLAVAAGVIGAYARVPDDQIAPGVQVGEVKLSGKSIESARAAIHSWAEQQQARSFLLKFDPESGIKKEWRAQAQKLGLGVDIDATLDKTLKEGRSNLVGQMTNIVTGGKAVHSVSPILTVDDAKLRAYLKEIGKEVGRKPRNATLEPMAGGGFGTHKEVPGVQLDLDASARAVADAWQTLLKNGVPGPEAPVAGAPGGTQETTPTDPGKSNSESTTTATNQEMPIITLSVKAAQPEISAADLDQVRHVVAEYQTYYTGTSNRRSNVALAARKINGTLLKPGEIFSYNKVVGPREVDAGFKEAPQYVNGKHVPGTGGGICQVSSTLFNAAWTGGLKIVHRQNHSMPVGYLRHGRDATAVYGAIDMQFQNDTDAPLYISASARGGLLHFALWGKKNPNREVILIPGRETVVPAPVVKRTDPRLPAGRKRYEEKGSPGINVTWTRIIKDNGEVVKKEAFHSHYTAFPAVVVVGTAAPKPAPTKSAPPVSSGTVPGAPASAPSGPPTVPPIR